MPETEPSLLEVRGVTKRFPGVLAVDQVNVSLKRGEVLALIGENGAGKSTLMKILAGVQEPDAGEILIDGVPVRIHNVQEALKHGISLIHQELNLADNLDIGANIFLGREPLKAGLIDKKKIEAESRKYLEMVGIDVDPRQILSELTIGRQQLVEIAKALSVDARVLIMDEPTSSLSSSETEALFKVIKDLRDRGVSVIYISHRLSEVVELADRVTVLRDGCNAGDLLRAEVNHDAMVNLMVGRDVSQFYDHHTHPVGDLVLKVRGLRTTTYPGHTIDFDLHAGEIVGMSGLVGAGRTELLLTLFGVTPALEGTIWCAGQPVTVSNPRQAIKAGMALVPEDRKSQGLVLDMSVLHNLSLASLERDQWFGFLNRPQEGRISATMVKEMRIKTPSERQISRFLSGGNQQKVVLGKWLAMEPKVLLLDEPTRGIDVGAKEEIYRLMEELAGRGVAILFVSSEMEEILGMSDRTVVMHEGRITGELKRDELSETAIMQLATGKVQAA